MHAATAHLPPGWNELLAGRYAEGWPLFDERQSRRFRVQALADQIPEWRGEDLSGKHLLLYGEQGIGDEVMFARFLPRLRALGAARIVVAAHPANLRLFRQLGADEAIDRTRDVPIARPDVWGMLASAPRWLGITLETVPGAPYLTAAPQRRGGVGVAWHGQRANPRDRFRSLPSGERLLALPGAIELRPSGDVVDSLEQVAGLDLVISVDTAWAHLAGALGKRLRLLLPSEGLDWRWMEGRTDSPWYPTARLYRQTTPGRWDEVIERVLADL